MMEKTTAYQFEPFSGGWVPAIPTSATKRIAIVQLGRYGDIVNALPIAYAMAKEGNEVHWYCDVNFIDIFEPVSYVFVHPLNIGDASVMQAEAIVKSDGGYDEIIVCQVNGNRHDLPFEADNFTLKQWAHAGPEWLERYHDYRPIFNRRDYAGEAKATAFIDERKPVLLVSLRGHSSPYPHEMDQMEWIRREFSSTYTIIDLGQYAPGKPENPNPNTLAKVHHILGFLTRADAILTIDTLPLHLAAATLTPTLQLSAGKTPDGKRSIAYDSECRENVVFKCSYDESVKLAWRNRMKTILLNREFELGKWVRRFDSDSFEPLGGQRIVHVADWYTGCHADNPRIFRARATWEELRRDRDYTIRLHELAEGQRSSADLRDTRTLPYIRDIIDYGCAGADNDDIIMFSNSDVCLVPEALGEIRRKLAGGPCCFSRRVDVKDCAPKLRLRDLRRAVAHVGADLFAMTKRFWIEHRAELPDVFLACEGWDFICRHWMLGHNLNAEMGAPLIWHQEHRSFWAQPGVIHDNPGQIHNRRECERFARENGCEGAIYGMESRFMFRPDGSFVKPVSPHRTRTGTESTGSCPFAR